MEVRIINRNVRYILLIACLLLVSCVFWWIYDSQYNYQITFSEPSGYYAEDFELQIYGGGAYRIYYTLDGSEPTTEDLPYESGMSITISDASLKENLYSARTDTSTGFRSDLIETYSDWCPDYTVPGYSVDKCNVVRASVFDQEGNCLHSIYGEYFVGFQEKSAYDGIYTVSIVTDPDNLFDENTGIYTTGAVFEEYVEMLTGGEEPPHQGYWFWWTANYGNRGMEWERPAHITVFNSEQELELSQHCGIRIQGGGSRGYLPKSLACYARDTYSGANEFFVDWFGSDINPHKFVLFSGGDDYNFKLKDYLANQLGQPLSFSTMVYIPCAMFLNGEYWGTYYIAENYNKDYISDHYHVEKDNVIMVKNEELADGTGDDMGFYTEMKEFISSQDMTVQENYRKACDLIDIDSYIDYYAAQIYIARLGDWPGSNFALWRTREKENSAYGDCKWRWMLFDVNSHGIRIDNLENDTLGRTLEWDAVFRSLFQNESFRLQFARRILDIGESVFSAHSCDAFISDYQALMTEPVLASNMRFHNDAKADAFEQYTEEIREFFNKRYPIVWNFLAQHLGEEWLAANGITKASS